MKRRIKVLIVDDESDMRFFLCNLLGGCGYATIQAADRNEGLRKAKKEKPAVIILDVMMPNEDGLQFYRELKQDDRLRGIPVIMVSSVGKHTFWQYQRSYCTLPEADPTVPGAYLKKPLNADELIGWVHALTAAAPGA
ncbi:MAG TPA: response regulator [Desulfobacterales bacterium]|nr:response regulator [Desulfobacterales bacterium]